MIRTTDRFLSQSRGTVEDVIAFWETNPPARRQDSEAIIRRVYDLCAASGVDFSLCVSRIADETGAMNGPSFFVSDIYRERLNIGGLGVTDGGDEGISFTDPIKSADAYMSHLFTYVLGESFNVLGVTPADDPRFDATPKAWRGSITTLQSLTGKWFTNPDGAINSANRGNYIFTVPDQSPTPTTGGAHVALDIDIALVNRGFGALTDRTPNVTIHNTGSGSNRSQERAFVVSGGGDQGVAYHFATDETGITQIMPLWQQGIHAGNVDGNRRSIAIEMCMNREPWSAVKENTAQLLAMLHLRDPRLDWSGAEGFSYSLGETTEHRAWPGANPNCPQRLIATDGGYPVLVERAKAIVAGTKPPKPPKVQPHPIGGETDGKGSTRDINGTLWLWVNKMFFLERDVQAYEYANLTSRTGPKFKGGKNIRINYIVSGDGKDGTPELYGTTRLGWRILLKDLI